MASLPSDDTGFLSVKARMDRDLGTHSDHEVSEESDSDWDTSDVCLDAGSVVLWFECGTFVIFICFDPIL